jgi:hypothetical protein
MSSMVSHAPPPPQPHSHAIAPRAAKVALEVGVLVQARVAVRGQHLAMRVHVDALVLGVHVRACARMRVRACVCVQ